MAGIPSEVAFEESTVNHAKKQMHELVLQVCRTQRVHRQATAAVEAEHTIPGPQQCLVRKALCDHRD